MALDAKGKWLFLYNDDIQMNTDGWDSQILSHKEFSILHPFVPNAAAHRKSKGDPIYCMTPIIPKSWVDNLSYIVPKKQAWADTWIMDVAREIGIFKMLTSVELYHKRYKETGDPAMNDRTFKEGRRRRRKAKKQIPARNSSKTMESKREAIEIIEKMLKISKSV